MTPSVTRYGLPGKSMTLDQMALWSRSRHQKGWLYCSQLSSNFFLGSESRQHIHIFTNIHPLFCSGPLLHICFGSRSSRVLIASLLVSKLRRGSLVEWTSTIAFGLESTNDACHCLLHYPFCSPIFTYLLNLGAYLVAWPNFSFLRALNSLSPGPSET